MTSKQISILLGGVLPAILLGVSGVLQKASTKAGVAVGPFLIATGLTTVGVGLAFLAWERDAALGLKGLFCSALFGTVWATAAGCIMVALRHYGGQISQLVPLYNTNTLVAVVIGLAVFSEWQSVDIPRLTLAALLIVVGGVLAASS